MTVNSYAVFYATTVHSGDAYTVHNIRGHAYLDHPASGNFWDLLGPTLLRVLRQALAGGTLPVS